MVTEEWRSNIDKLPDWARQIYEKHGSPNLKNTVDVFHGPLIDRRYGLRKDDLVEIIIDNRVLKNGESNRIGGMLIGTSRNSVDILDNNGDFRAISRDVIIEIKLVIHMRRTYLEDEELLKFEKEDIKRRTNVQEMAEKQAEGRIDSHIWD